MGAIASVRCEPDFAITDANPVYANTMYANTGSITLTELAVSYPTYPLHLSVEHEKKIFSSVPG